MKKHYLVYKITNLLNGKIYIGIHSTDNIDDGYMGSGKHLKRAQKKYGIENFKKEILFDFDKHDEMLEMEAKIVNEEFVKREDTYNLIKGGLIDTTNTIPVRNKDGYICRVSKDDPRYLSGELKFMFHGTVTVKDEHGNMFHADLNDPRYLSGELKPIGSGMVNVKDEYDKIYRVRIDDPRYLSGELKPIGCGMVNVKDKEGNIFHISTDDIRYQIGELMGIWTGRKHSEETKKKMSETAKERLKDPTKNSQYGTCWIYNEELKENKKIKKEELQEWINKGWIKGRKIN